MIIYVRDIDEAEKHLSNLSKEELERAALVEPAAKGSKLILSLFKTGESEEIHPAILDSKIKSLDVDKVFLIGQPAPHCLKPVWGDREDTRQALEYARKIMDLVVYDPNRSQIDYLVECLIDMVRTLEADTDKLLDIISEYEDDIKEYEYLREDQEDSDPLLLHTPNE